MTLDDLRQIVTVLAPMAIIVGVLVAIVQIRDLRRVRQMETVMRLFDRFDDEDFQQRFQHLMRWKFRNLEDFERRAREDDWVTLNTVTVFFESMGTLYKRGLAPLELLDDLLSGPITSCWGKIGPLWIEYRKKRDRPMMAEWFELLATDMEKRLARLEGRQPRLVRLEGTADSARPSGNRRAAAKQRRPRQG